MLDYIVLSPSVQTNLLITEVQPEKLNRSDTTINTDCGMRDLMLDYVKKDRVCLSKTEELLDVFSQAPAFEIEMVTSDVFDNSLQEHMSGMHHAAEYVQAKLIAVNKNRHKSHFFATIFIPRMRYVFTKSDGQKWPSFTFLLTLLLIFLCLRGFFARSATR